MWDSAKYVTSFGANPAAASCDFNVLVAFEVVAPRFTSPLPASTSASAITPLSHTSVSVRPPAFVHDQVRCANHIRLARLLLCQMKTHRIDPEDKPRIEHIQPLIASQRISSEPFLI